MRYLRRQRGLAAVTAALLLVPAALAGDAVNGWSVEDRSITPEANGLGRGFFGIDLEDLGASGQLPEVDGLSDELMKIVGDPNALASAGDPINTPAGVLSIPGSALAAYKKAESLLAASQPGCKLHWSLLASIGRIESNHGRGGAVNAKGDTLEKILGPVLNGAGFAAIQDSDGGALDGDPQWDRAVGPMQFIPATWNSYAADGNGDGVKSPHNFYDAALAAGKYLCSGGLDLSNDQQRGIAVFRYNHSESYVRTVLIWAKAYEAGVNPIPDGTGVTTGTGGTGTGTNTNPNAQAAPPPAQTPIATTPAPPPPPPNNDTTITPKPPVDPPTDPPTKPPTSPPTDPPTSPPTDPPTSPPTSPPTNPPTTSTPPTTSKPAETTSKPAETTKVESTSPASTSAPASGGGTAGEQK